MEIQRKNFDEFMLEIHLLTSTSKKKPKEESKPKRDPYGEDPAETRKRIKQKSQIESFETPAIRRARDAHAQLVAAKKAKHAEKPLRPGEVKRYDPKTKTYISNLPSSPETPKPLRPGEVRKFNKETGRWESNKD